MKKVSHSEITTYLDCQKKWKLQYQDKISISNPHFKFGEMAHKVLETREIPNENLYIDLKEYFDISSWSNYFNYIFVELDKFLKDYEIIGQEVLLENEQIKGVADLILKDKITGQIVICDYKFSNSVKDYVDLSLDEQMYIYAVLYSILYDISIDNIDICYISIPKKDIREPRILTNGKLSKDKGQNTTYDKYLNAIKKLGLDVNDYIDVLNALKNKEFLHIYRNVTDVDKALDICSNIDNVILDMNKGYILEKHSYMCKSCPYLRHCKGIKL